MFVYGLYDEFDRIRYVGQTTGQITRRLYGHIHNAKTGRVSHNYNWIRSMLKQGVTPVVKELASTDNKEQLNILETFYILVFRNLGADLTNMSEGGEGGRFSKEVYERMVETRRKNGKSTKGYKLSPETRKSISDRMKGNRLSVEIKQKISIGLLGRKKDLGSVLQSVETKKKLGIYALASKAAWETRHLNNIILNYNDSLNCYQIGC